VQRACASGLLSVLPLAYARQVAFVDLSRQGDKPAQGYSAPSPLGADQVDSGEDWSLVFSAAYAKSGKPLPQGAATSASNQEHPESAALLERGDAVVFLVPIGNWAAEKVASEEISVSIRR
jgi:hypothetical protein